MQAYSVFTEHNNYRYPEWKNVIVADTRIVDTSYSNKSTSMYV